MPGARRRIHFAFPEPPRTGRRVATLTGVHKAYGDNVVYAGMDFAVERGERVALVGENGAGKSTLLKILAGVLPFDRGERTLGAHVAVHYYAQHQLDALDPTRTVLEELEAVAPEATHTRLRTILGAFLFSGDAVEKKVAVLSGGEKARLALARMLVRPAALLCLDEPTNHLDLASREVLEEALAGFPGTIVFISHDRYFINRIATVVVEVAGGVLTQLPGLLRRLPRGQGARRSAGRGPPSPDRPAARGRRARPRGRQPPARRARRPASAPAGPRVRGSRRRRPSAARRGAASSRSAERGDPGAASGAWRRSSADPRAGARLAEIGATLSDPRLYLDGDRVRAVSRRAQGGRGADGRAHARVGGPGDRAGRP